MKGLINANGKLVKLVKGKPIVSEDEPAVFPDSATIESITTAFSTGGVDVDMKGLKLVPLDVTIDKPKPKYSPAKKVVARKTK